MAERKRTRLQQIEDEARGRGGDEDDEARGRSDEQDEARGRSEEGDEARGRSDDDEEATAETDAVEKGDPLSSQGYGEEDFSERDYSIPGVESDDPDPYNWHTGKKRDHGGEDAI